MAPDLNTLLVKLLLRLLNSEEVLRDQILLELSNLKSAVQVLNGKVTNMENNIMAELSSFATVIASIDAETTRIGTKIDTLVTQLANKGLTAEEEASVLAQLSTAANRLKTIGADPENPVPVDPDPNAPTPA